MSISFSRETPTTMKNFIHIENIELEIRTYKIIIKSDSNKIKICNEQKIKFSLQRDFYRGILRMK